MDTSTSKSGLIRPKRSCCTRIKDSRYWLIPLLFLIGVVVIATKLPEELNDLGIRLRRSNLQGNGDQGIEVDIPTPRPVKATLRPTSPPSAAQAPALLPTSVTSMPEYRIISPHIRNPKLLTDNNTPQGKAFSSVLRMELKSTFQMRQSFALLMLYFSTDGPNWNLQATPNIFSRSIDTQMKFGWDDYTPSVCSWYGVKCATAIDGEEVVISIALGKIELLGPISCSI